MAVIARSFVSPIVAVSLFTCLASALQGRDREGEIRAEIGRIATALSAGNPADALVPFSKSFAGYEKLRDYFSALTNSYNIVNEAEIMSEEDAAMGSKLVVNWSMTLNGRAEEPGRQRSAELQLRFAREGDKWKIVGLSPLAFFDPAAP